MHPEGPTDGRRAGHRASRGPGADRALGALIAVPLAAAACTSGGLEYAGPFEEEIARISFPEGNSNLGDASP